MRRRLLPLALVLLAGCAHGQEPEAAQPPQPVTATAPPDAERAPDDAELAQQPQPVPEVPPEPGRHGPAGASEASLAGITIRVDARSWPGSSAVTASVSPVRVVLENRAQVPLRVRYDAFTLRAGDAVAEALPPWELTPTARAVGHPVRPGFAAAGFLLAPEYAPFYEGVSVWDGPFARDPLWYARTFGYWPSEVDLEAVRARALPEGVVRPGGRVDGFLYFRQLTPEGGRAVFRADLVDADTGEQFAVAEIPLEVAPAAKRLSHR